MALSIIEFAVYGFVAYSSILMLIISTIRTAELGKALSIIRAIYMIPGVICSSVLANAGVEITMPSQTSVLIAASGNMTETISSSITLVNPAWITLHYLFMAILIIYVISQMIILFTKIE